MKANLTDEEFAQAQDLLSAAAGLAFETSRRESLGYSLGERMARTGLTTVKAYLERVRADPAERQQLLDEVTIQETHFFRNPPQVRALRSHVLPELIREAAGKGRRLRVWSAGCSTGEEPYSVAMLLRELLGEPQGWDVRVLATDVSQRALAAAAAATYGTRAVQMATDEQRARFFARLPDGSWQVRPEVRELVELRHHNLVTEPVPFAPGERVDLILCRNVTIYFSRETTRALIQRLHGCLRDGGYLFLGHSETLWQISEDFRLVPLGTGDSAAFVYRRLDGGPGERRRVLPDRRTEDEGPPAAERRSGARRAGLREAPVPGSEGRPAARGTAPGEELGAGSERRQGARRAGLREALVRPRRLFGDPRPEGRRGPAAGDADPAPPPPPGGSAAGGSGGDPVVAVRKALDRGAYDEAVGLADAAVAAAPLHGDGHYLRGLALVSLGRDPEAAVDLRKAVYLDPGFGLAHFLLAGVLSRLGHPAAAAREYRAAAETLGTRAGDATASELGGRTVEELAALCAQLEVQLNGAAG